MFGRIGYLGRGRLGALGATLALLGGVGVACNDNPASTNHEAPGADMSGAACAVSADCTGEDVGKLCVSGECVACEEDAQCAADVSYTDGARSCVDGACGACGEGDIGCVCDAEGACAMSECVGDVCVDCDRGDLGCLCRSNGTCKEGSRCGDDGVCVECSPGEPGCPCDVGGSCGEGHVCQADVCVPNTCEAGQTGCGCDQGACSSGADYCDESSVCQECVSDVPGCGCDPGDTCQGDNYCDEDTVCQACPDSQRPESCGCQETSDCRDGLICDEEDSACREAVGCDALDCGLFACDDSDGDAECLQDACVAGYTYDPVTGTCAEPSAETCLDAMGAPTAQALQCEMQGKACAVSINGVVCVDTCSTLDCQQQNRDCAPAQSEDADAVCGACAPGYVLVADPADATQQTCEPNPLSNCSANDIDSILTDCESRAQECVPGDSGGATCGACKAGRIFDADANACVAVEVCGSSICVDAEFCFYPQNGAPPECRARCAAGQAYDEATNTCIGCNVQCGDGGTFASTILDAQGTPTCACAEDVFCSYHSDGVSRRCFESECEAGEAKTEAGQCSDCPLNCGDDPGESTRVWPTRDNTGECFCETLQGSYRPYGNSAKPELCDVDQDGWINRTAKLTFDDATQNMDAAMRSNFRCERREIDRVRLVNEYGQRRDVSLCDGGFHDYAPGSYPTACATAAEREKIILFEADALDDDAKLSLGDSAYPLYGARRMRASEVNSMTKACISINADYNANGVQDVVEAQPFKRSNLADPTVSDDEFFFHGLSFFTELHTSYYQPPSVGGEPGVYVIAERSRCDAGFPLTYPEAKEDYYWDQCTRGRRGDFDNQNAPKPGFDFADYHCGQDDGTCDLPDVIATLGAGGDGDDYDDIVDHDLCSLAREGKLPLPDDRWLGMTHSSQFQCAQFKSTLAMDALAHHVGLDNVYDGTPQAANPTQFVANLCDATKQCADSTDPGCHDSEPVVSSTDPTLALIAQPRAAAFECEAKNSSDVAQDSVGFALVRYIRPEGNGNSLAYDGMQYVRGCMDESKGTDGRGWSQFCPGYQENPAAVKAAGNSGNFGALVCTCSAGYGGLECEIGCPGRGGSTMLHVGGPNARVDDPTSPLDGPDQQPFTEWACDPNDFYCLLYPPTELSSGEIFPGGRRGYWMCADFSLTRSAPGVDPVMRETTAAGDVFELDGQVEKTPLRRSWRDETDPANPRDRVLESTACATPGTGDCFELF